MPTINAGDGMADVSTEGKPLPEGTYRMVVSEAPTIEPTQKGDSMKLVIKPRIVEGPLESPDPELSGRNYRTQSIGFKAAGILASFFLACGCDLKDVQANKVTTEELAGCEFSCVIIQKPYKRFEGTMAQETAIGTEIAKYLPVSTDE